MYNKNELRKFYIYSKNELTKLQKGILLIQIVNYLYSETDEPVSCKCLADYFSCTERYIVDLVREIQKVDSRLVSVRGRKGGYIYKL